MLTNGILVYISSSTSLSTMWNSHESTSMTLVLDVRFDRWLNRLI